MKKLPVLLAISVTAALCGAPASAQFSRPESAIKYRQSGMFLMGQHFSRVAAMANGRVPFDAKVAAENAEVVAFMSKIPWNGYVKEAPGGRAKPNIWTEQAKFKELNEKMMDDAAKLSAAAKTGNLDALKAAVRAADATCTSCHDTFRGS
ncbi:MAG: cytochrome c [Burkholderiaceae bacterium]|nr:cytochrome c [Burkholderiaceae bacterium]MDO9089470.1 cytochrome c [Burkholderiaceae bacterium]MDP1968128.1 cytochrome c [Burkholderiaceae bacterium]